MYTGHIYQVQHFKLFQISLKLWELVKFYVKASLNKSREETSSFNFLLKSLQKDKILIDTGGNEHDYLYRLVRLTKHVHRVITFQPNANSYHYLRDMQQILQLNNFVIEPLALGDTTGHKIQLARNNFPLKETPVINIKNAVCKQLIEVDTIDCYCNRSSTKPDYLKISEKGNELNILHGAIQVITQYKPVIFIECEERQAGRNYVLDIFTFFKEHNYKGYFLLDTIKIPLENFDFDLYQNPRKDFYCNQFIFEPYLTNRLQGKKL